MEKIKRFFKEEEGLEMTEYALMGAIICLGVVVTVGLLKDSIIDALTDITTAMGSR